jgi:dolichol-phosphate mannosyltransferase
LIEKILGLNIKELDILVVDDNSPDGTANIVKNMKDRHVQLLLRKSNRGRGLAGIAGFRWALENDANYVIEMDADFSHDPRYIPKMLEMAKNNDVVLGSRLVAGSKDVERTSTRKAITLFANFYVRNLLGIKIRDINSGYRCFRREALEAVVDELKARGPDIVQEVIYKASKKGFKVREFPIEFKDRSKGKSKLGTRQIIRGLVVPIKLRLQ